MRYGIGLLAALLLAAGACAANPLAVTASDDGGRCLPDGSKRYTVAIVNNTGQPHHIQGYGGDTRDGTYGGIDTVLSSGASTSFSFSVSPYGVSNTPWTWAKVTDFTAANARVYPPSESGKIYNYCNKTTPAAP